jgi:DNA processing protein
MSKRCVSIVGTRDCTRYGTDVAYRFGKGLAEHGVVVVSGLADGIDTAAHKGAVSAKNDDGILSIAVLGNGVNYYYPQSNASLQKDLAQNGLIISEYIPSTPSDRFHFPHRNRIIAALCSAVIVVEADNRSGALITKDYALDLGVDVFAVPGPITSYASNGTNKIIKTAAVAMITDIADVLDTFGVTVRGEEENSVTQISFEAQSVLDVLGRDEVHFDEIVEKTKYAPKTVASLLTNMEIDGLILKLSGNYYTSKVMKKRK